MKLTWTIIDGIVTLPAYLAGYIFAAYVGAFNLGRLGYAKNVRDFWIGAVK